MAGLLHTPAALGGLGQSSRQITPPSRYLWMRAQARLRGFLQGLKQSGWTEGRNVRIDARWGAGDADLYRNAAELIALAPDVRMKRSARITERTQDRMKRSARITT